MSENENENFIEIEHDFEDKFCLLKAQITLEEFVQLTILKDIIEEELDSEHKQLLKDIYKEEKDRFHRSKAELDQCMYVNGNSTPGRTV